MAAAVSKLQISASAAEVSKRAQGVNSGGPGTKTSLPSNRAVVHQRSSTVGESNPGRHTDRQALLLFQAETDGIGRFYEETIQAQGTLFSTIANRLLRDAAAHQGGSLANTIPYSHPQLDSIARNCTLKEDAARKVERVMNKRIAAVGLRNRIGETFAAVVAGVTPKGVFVRVLGPPPEGLLTSGQQGVDVGDQLRVRLVSTDLRRGYIDFAGSDNSRLAQIGTRSRRVATRSRR